MATKEKGASTTGAATLEAPLPTKKTRFVKFEDTLEENPGSLFLVQAKVRTWKEHTYIEKVGRMLPVDMSERRATLLNLTIKGHNRNASGDLIPVDYSHTPELPFTTFDNPWVAAGQATPREVAHAVFHSPAFGNSVELIPYTEEEADEYRARKMSPAVQEARERASNVNPMAVLEEQERLMSGSNQGFGQTGGNSVFGSNQQSAYSLPPIPL